MPVVEQDLMELDIVFVKNTAISKLKTLRNATFCARGGLVEIPLDRPYPPVNAPRLIPAILFHVTAVAAAVPALAFLITAAVGPVFQHERRTTKQYAT